MEKMKEASPHKESTEDVPGTGVEEGQGIMASKLALTEDALGLLAGG